MNVGPAIHRAGVTGFAVRCIPFIAVTVLTFFTPTARAQGWPGVFDPLELLTLNLQVDPEDWEVVEGDLSFDIEVPAKFYADGEEPILVSVRRQSGNALGSKVSLKIDINEFEDQTWHGLKKVSLENGYETDVISEGFAWYLHRLAASMSTSSYDPGLAAWVRLFVNDEYLGVYVNVEQPDKQFLINRGLFVKKKTWLYKQTGVYKAELEVGSERKEAICYFPFSVKGFANGCDTPDDDTLAAELPTLIDMDAMLTQGAVGAFTTNPNALFSGGKNFCYVDFGSDLDQPRLYIPWNLHSVFTASKQSIYGSLKGGRGPGLQQTPYERIILGHPAFGERYRQILGDLLEGPFAAEPLLGFLAALETLLTPAIEEDPASNLDVSVAERFDQIAEYVTGRASSLDQQLSGTTRYSPDLPDPQPLTSKSSYIEVGEGRGKPGDIVEVEVKGGTHVKVNGFAFAVGMGQRIKVESIKLGEFFESALGDTKHFVSAVHPRGSPEPYYNVFLGFYGIAKDESGVTAIAPSIVIPPDTTLVKVRYRIPPDYPAPAEQVLFSRTRWFKKTAETNQMIAVTSMYTTEPDVSRHGIDAVLVSGKIYVEAP